ncbi:MAG: peptidoglycan DD-metalloendopeptidase family protein [Flavobacteriaceae bacterium]
MKNNDFKNFLRGCTQNFTPVIDKAFVKTDYFPIDLSVANQSLKSIDFSSSDAVEHYINDYLQKNNSKVAYGGYIEQRAIYQRSSHFNQQDPETERNIHLGMDLWVQEKTDVLAVLDGEIHSFKDNTNFGDYGPTIILKHHFANTTFYTLYGHLSRESLTRIQVGQKFNQGEAIAQLGSAEVNGDYAPHLHFQIIKEIGTYLGDYPGVCSKKDLNYFSENCPDPNLVLKLIP